MQRIGTGIVSPATGMAHGLFVLHVRSWDPQEDVTTGSSDKRMVLITDMGIIEKRDATARFHVFVQSNTTYTLTFYTEGFEAGGGRSVKYRSVKKQVELKRFKLLDYADAREDRVILYGSVGSNTEKVVYRIKPVAKGTYAVPPAFVKSMYDPAESARTRSSRIAVVER